MTNSKSSAEHTDTMQHSKTGTIKAKSDAAHSLRDLFVDELKDIYWAENALTKAIPKMIANASNPEIIKGFEKHLAETQNQVKRLEDVFSSLGEKAEAKKCEAMAGITKEAEEIMSETEMGDVRDAGILSAARKVEHYEIATYGTLIAFANKLGEKTAAKLLQSNLDEETATDSKLYAMCQAM